MRPTILLAFLASFIVMAKAEEAADEVKVMTFNCWYSLAKINDGPAKAISAIRKSHADIIGLQECSEETAGKLAAALGFHRVQPASGAVQIITRFPIIDTFPVTGIDPSRAAAARIRTGDTPSRDLIFYNIHLDAGNYGPYATRTPGSTAEQVLALENKSPRPAQIAGILESMSAHLAEANKTPVVLTGDFNSPSHLDWTEGTAASHGGVANVDWPASILPQRAGLIDSFRLLHPDPAALPGNTWSAIHKGTEPQDRIDFIFHKGKPLSPVSSRTFSTSIARTIGAWGEDITPVVDNEWPSDHHAVVTVYRFTR